jgi:hypothetical protein
LHAAVPHRARLPITTMVFPIKRRIAIQKAKETRANTGEQDPA